LICINACGSAASSVAKPFGSVTGERKRTMKAHDVMTRKVWTTTLDTPVRKAAQTMIARAQGQRAAGRRRQGAPRGDRRYVKSQSDHVGDVMRPGG
jgi:hypothetical protein